MIGKIDLRLILSLPLLERSIIISAIYHAGQLDKGGTQYIFHPLSVALELKNEKEQVVAILHDVVEDTEITFEDLEVLGFTEEIIEAVRSITKRKKEDYFVYVRRAKLNDIGLKVKREDLLKNMDISRIPNPTERDMIRLEMYKKALNLLEEK